MDELNRKMQGFKAHLPPDIFLDPTFVGFRINCLCTELTVIWTSDEAATQRGASLNSLPALMTFLQQEGLTLKSVNEEIPRAQQTPAGSPGFGQGLGGWGTLGWFIELDGQLVCVSNYHVFCPAGDQTARNSPIYSGIPGQAVQIGILYDFDAMEGAYPRLFDFALAAITNLDLINSTFRPCDDGSVHLYPRRLGFSQDLKSTDIYMKVGARSPICSEGKYRGLTSTYVKYDNGKRYFFDEQLLLDPISLPGDSGSVLIHKQSNRVVGLIFAGIEGVQTVANPIYRKGWDYIGTRAVGEFEIPKFTTRQEIKVPVAPLLRAQLGSPELPPNFTAGRKIPPPLQLAAWSRDAVPNGTVEVVQPFGEWVEVKKQTQSQFGPIWNSGWLHAASGMVYPIDA